ncbi:MAG TPA: serine hydrolase [Urbifossiella sp.]|nr:serine hydrolase [Urbifossiella sp.]
MRHALLALVLFPLPAAAQSAVPPPEKYAAAAAELDAFIAEQVADKRLPALSIALVDGGRIVWAKGFGFQDAAKKTPATAETIYRVGSVSKLFTDVAIMQLVEKGKLDLDAPVSTYLPDFKPRLKPDQKPITLRMLMAHRSGLIREPPVGNYFDPTEPGLEKTVASLNDIDAVYPPGERIKYSNAAIGVVGYVLQKTQGERFESYVQHSVLDVLDMKSSAFEPTPTVRNRLADAVMWSYHGREFPTATFQLGTSSAGCMYSTVIDLAKFTSRLFAGGKVGDKQLLQPASIDKMFAPQFAKEGAKSGFGLGFMIGQLDGHKSVGHGGAIYGFATEWLALPDKKLAAIVVVSRDVANPVVTRIAEDSLRLMLAVNEGKPLPKLERTKPLAAGEARRLAGRYRDGDRWIDLEESFGKLYATPDRCGSRFRIRKTDAGFIADDIHAWGTRFAIADGKLTIGKLTLTKEAPSIEPPPAPPEKWRGLIGEYGWDHNMLFIYERGGKLHALIEWTEIDPLTEESENVFAFPADRGMYHGEKLIFTRDKNGRAAQVEAAHVLFKRRTIDGENGATFKIKPVRPLDQLRKEALAAKPPAERGQFLKPDLIDLAAIPGIKFDIRYATENNFLGTKFYNSAKAFMQRPAAEALARVNEKLAASGYGLLVHDSYRPWFVTKMFWDATPAKFHGFVANPRTGSRHNRGCAVDLTLYDLKSGKPIEMVSGYDEFSDRAFPDYPGGTSRQRWHRDLLRRTMNSEGFTIYEEEWWHFDFKDWRKYPILNSTFEELGR